MNVKSETLERLLIDHAAGALEPDVGELLDAWLTHDPQAAATASELRETMDLAQQVLRRKRPEPLPPLQVRPAQPRRRWRLSRLLVHAACAAAGFLAALAVADKVVVPPSPPVRIVRLAAEPPAREVAAASSFWTMENLYQPRSHSRSAPANRTRVIWTSPVKPPEIRGEP